MGSGRWSTDVYDAAARYRRATGTSAFAYSDSGARTVHARLDPRGVAMRESRDSAEHPRSTAIAVLFDVTGSMRAVPRTLQTRLPELLGLLLRKGYATDPQILFGAVGDATCDRVPLQIGQFESDNRMDDDLAHIVLEGGGGGQRTESYELAMYFMARHTALDCHERRGRRGYLFLIGDELPYRQVKPQEVRRVIGDELLVDPLALAAEADNLASLGVGDPFALLTVDADAPLVTPWHRAANRVRERRRGAGRHGSCGMGVGEAAAYALAHPGDAPRAGDVAAPGRLRRRLTALRDRLADELGRVSGVDDVDGVDGPWDLGGRGWPPVEDVAEAFAAFGRAVPVVDGPATLRRLLAAGRCVFEGAQGVLLDERFGWHPHTTWSTTTFANATTLIAEVGAGPEGHGRGAPGRGGAGGRGGGGGALRLGVVRAYTTRHGPGPLVTEDPAVAAATPEPHNATGAWQGAFRAGHFDAVAHRYAIEVAGGVDGLAVTHLDTPARVPGLGICPAYLVDGQVTGRIVPGVRGDLDHQRQLTAWLDRASPAALHRASPADWATAVATELDAPVLLESHGPAAADKRLRRLLSPAGR